VVDVRDDREVSDVRVGCRHEVGACSTRPKLRLPALGPIEGSGQAFSVGGRYRDRKPLIRRILYAPDGHTTTYCGRVVDSRRCAGILRPTSRRRRGEGDTGWWTGGGGILEAETPESDRRGNPLSLFEGRPGGIGRRRVDAGCGRPQGTCLSAGVAQRAEGRAK